MRRRLLCLLLLALAGTSRAEAPPLTMWLETIPEGAFMLSALLTEDGSSVISTHYDGTLRRFDADSGRTIRVVPIGRRASLARHGGTIAVCGDGRLELWRADLSGPTQSFPSPRTFADYLLFSPDGRWIAMAGRSDPRIGLLDLESGRARLVKLERDSNLTVERLAFTADGAAVGVFAQEGHPTKAPGHVELFARDGTRLASGEETALVRELRARPVRPGEPGLDRIARPVLSSAAGRELQQRGVFDAETGELISRIGGSLVEEVGHRALSASGRFLLIGETIWDLEQLQPRPSPIKSRSAQSSRAMFLGDEALLVWRAGSPEGIDSLERLDLATGLPSGELRLPHRKYDPAILAVSSDGRRFLEDAGAWFVVRDTTTGAELRRMKQRPQARWPGPPPLRGHRRTLVARSFSPDLGYAIYWRSGTGLATRSDEDSREFVTVERLRDQKIVAQWGVKQPTTRGPRTLYFSDDEASAWQDDGVALTFPEQRTLAYPRAPGALGPRASFAVSRDGTRLVEPDGRVRFELPPLGTTISRVLLSADGRRVVVVGAGTFRVIDATTGHRVDVFQLGRGDWLALDDDGDFDGTPRGIDVMTISDGERAFGLNNHALVKNRPDRMLERLGSSDVELIELFRSRHTRRLASLGLAGVADGDAHVALAPPRAELSVVGPVDGDVATVRCRCQSVDARTVTHLQVTVNGVAVIPYGPPAATPASTLTRMERVRLGSGRNRVALTCLDAAGAASPEATVTLHRPPSPRRPALWYVGLGVSRYEGDAFPSLAFAHKDVADLATALQAQVATGGFSAVHPLVLQDGAVNREALSTIRAALQRAELDDVVMLAVAGHGLHDNDARRTYYLALTDSRPDALPATALSFDELEAVLGATPARRRLLAIDTCESGGADGTTPAGVATGGGPGLDGLVRRGLTRAGPAVPRARSFAAFRGRYIFHDLAHRSGTVVLASSLGDEPSLESSALQNGLFTASLLDALGSGAADADRDRRVSLDELRAHALIDVPRRSGDAQHPTIERDNRHLRIEWLLPPP